jgi:hypothetical protein
MKSESNSGSVKKVVYRKLVFYHPDNLDEASGCDR